MMSEEFTDYILGKPVIKAEFMPKSPAANAPPILFGNKPGVIRITLAKDENGELRATGSPENIEAIKNLFSWLPGGDE